LIIGVAAAATLFYLAVIAVITCIFPDYDDWDEE